MSEIRERLEHRLISVSTGYKCACGKWRVEWLSYETGLKYYATHLETVIASLPSVAEQPQPICRFCEGTGWRFYGSQPAQDYNERAARCPCGIVPEGLPDSAGISEVNPPAQPGSAAQGSGTVSPTTASNSEHAGNFTAERAWNVLRATLRPMVQQGSGIQDRPGKSELASIRPDSPSSFVTDVTRGKGPPCTSCGAIMIPCTNPFAGWECRSCGETFTHPIDCICDEVQGLLPACPPVEQKVEEPTNAREWVSRKLSENSMEPCGDNVVTDAVLQIMEAYAAEQTASLRSQLEDEFNDRLNAASVDYVRVKKALEAAESALRSKNEELTILKTQLANLGVAAEQLASTELRSRESVEIDYDAEIATFNFIVSAIDTDHGYDIDKAKAAVWLRQFGERVRGRESAIDYEAFAKEWVERQDFPNEDPTYRANVARLVASALRSHDQRVQGRESVEKVLVEALGMLLESGWECDPKPGVPPCGRCPHCVGKAALSAYRQATQTESPKEKL